MMLDGVVHMIAKDGQMFACLPEYAEHFLSKGARQAQITVLPTPEGFDGTMYQIEGQKQLLLITTAGTRIYFSRVKGKC